MTGVQTCALPISVHSSGAEENNSSQNPGPPSKAALFLAVFTPLAFFGDILLMLLFGLKGGDATSLVSGTATLLMVLGAVLGFSFQAPEKVTDYLTHGFLFAIRIFAPVILIGAFFFMGGEGITSILGEHYQNGIMNDWAIWLAGKAPLNRYMAAALQMVIGTLTEIGRASCRERVYTPV